MRSLEKGRETISHIGLAKVNLNYSSTQKYYIYQFLYGTINASLCIGKVSTEPAGKRRSYSGAHQDAIKDINHLLKNHHIDRRGIGDAESLENLDNKIQEMRQTFSSTQSVRGTNNIHRLANPQDVVQSHYQQVQTMIQQQQQPAQKEEYFLTSSASETSLNDSLKSGNLEEHEVLDRSSCSTMAGQESQTLTAVNNSQLNVTSPKRSSPFPPVAAESLVTMPRMESIPRLEPFGQMLSPNRDSGPPSYSLAQGRASSLYGGLPGSRLALEPLPPSVGDIRQFHIEKTTEQLGINIREVAGVEEHQAGVFISSVVPHSLAARVGLHVGDQILEVCGINLRTARFAQAQAVLQMASRSIDIKVQYQPARLLQPSPAPTSPIMSRMFSGVSNYDDKTLQSRSSTLKSALQLDHLLPTAHSTLLGELDYSEQFPRQSGHQSDTPNYNRQEQYEHEPRLLNPVLKKSGELGVRLVGGNAVVS